MTGRTTTMLALSLLGLLAQAPAPQDAPPQSAADPFRALDLIIETDRPLAAYQIELVDQTQTAKIVGIEGNGELPFQNPPHHDPKAMAGDRLILAAFSTRDGDRLPKGRIRVATVMVQVGAEPPRWALKLSAAATVGGRPIEANISLTEGGQPR